MNKTTNWTSDRVEYDILRVRVSITSVKVTLGKKYSYVGPDGQKYTHRVGRISIFCHLKPFVHNGHMTCEYDFYL